MRMRHLLIASVLLGAACSSTSAQPPRTASTQTATAVVATVGSTSITLAEVDEKAMQQPSSSCGSLKLGQALYEARRLALEDIIGNKLMDQEAKASGIERSAL